MCSDSAKLDQNRTESACYVQQILQILCLMHMHVITKGAPRMYVQELASDIVADSCLPASAADHGQSHTLPVGRCCLLITHPCVHNSCILKIGRQRIYLR